MMKSLRLLAIAKKTVLFKQSSNRFFTINEIYGEIKILQSELHKLIKLNKIHKWLFRHTCKHVDDKYLTMLFESTVDMIDDFHKSMEV